MEQHIIWDADEYHYAGAGAFIPTLHSYLHENQIKRPAVIVVPGGAYAILSEGESGNVAKEFYNRGYQTFVLTYTNNVTLDHPLGLQPLKDLSRAVRYVRHFAEQFYVNTNQVAVMGFSAGGHLAGSLAVYYNLDEMKETGKYIQDSNRPDAVVLNYAAISAFETYEIRGAFENIFGKNITREQKEMLSLNLNIHSDMPPIFLGHGMNDSMCPVKHAMLMLEACREKGVDVEAHFWKNVNHSYGCGIQLGEVGKATYIYRQLYEYIQQMSKEEFRRYHELFGSLKKDIGFDEFVQIVLSECTTKIFLASLDIDFEGIVKSIMTTELNPNGTLWAEMEDHWMKLIFKEKK